MAGRRISMVLLGAVAAAVAAGRRIRGAHSGRRATGGTLIGNAGGYDALSRLLLSSFFGRIAADVAAVAPGGARVLEVGSTLPAEDASEGDPSSWPGEAKIAGHAIELTEPRRVERGNRFRVEIEEVVLTRVGDPADHLVIESWHGGRGFQRRERR